MAAKSTTSTSGSSAALTSIASTSMTTTSGTSPPSSDTTAPGSVSLDFLIGTIQEVVATQVAGLLSSISTASGSPAAAGPSSSHHPAIPLPTSSAGTPILSVPAGLSIPPPALLSSMPIFSSGTADSVPSLTISSLARPPSALLSLPTAVHPSVFLPSTVPPLPASKSHPLSLILSTALPPVPGKVVEKISKGEYVDLKELLPDNVALLKRLQEVNPSNTSTNNTSRFREIADPLSWVFCFLGFIAAKVDHPETRELLAYTQIIMDLARKHGGQGWLTYDAMFRQQIAAGSPLKWSELNSSLMAATVLSATNGAGRMCGLCMSSDHLSHECALAALDRFHPPTIAVPRPSRPQYSPYPARGFRSNEPCRRFNRGTCMARPCRYDHLCNICLRPGHSALDCRSRPIEAPIPKP